VTVRRVGPDDLDWAVDLLARRRARLVPYAPLYWRPARDARPAHRRHLDHVLGAGGGIGFRTDDAVLIAAPGRDGGWTVDDAVVPDGAWAGTGRLLWDALAGQVGGGSVRFVCPTPEPERGRFGLAQGLRLQASWWQAEVEQTREPLDGAEPQVDDATAALVPAPAIYDPGGPILLVTDVRDARRALASARTEAARLGSPIVVVDQRPGEQELGAALTGAGFLRHCDFLAGTIR
jgi:hypothetical protein